MDIVSTLDKSSKNTRGKNRCVNIDWLEVYALEDYRTTPCNAEFFRRDGWHVDERDYGTRVYDEMFTLYDIHDCPIIEIRRKPFSTESHNHGFFPPESCHIRLTNAGCYYPNAVNMLREFLARYNYELRKIYRLDICCDFEKFDKGDDPAKFMERYMAGRYAKVNQTNISGHGSDQWNGRVWNSVSWGKPKSMVSTKLYNKTLELAEVHDKPYIRQAWFASHLIDDPINMTKIANDGSLYKPDIWRVEFSIKSSAQRWFVIEKSTGKHGKIGMPHTLDIYDTKQKLLTVFSSLSEHYFHFKHYEENKRKDRCRDKVLFDFSAYDTFYRVDRLASHTPKSKPTERFLALVKNYRLTHSLGDVAKACDVLIDVLDRERLREFSGTMRDAEILQKLIAERISMEDKPDLSKHIKEITNALDLWNEISVK